MASGLCPNIKHVILHSLMELANQNEDSALCLCSNSASGQQRYPLAGEVVASLLQQLPQQEYLHSANEECPPPRRNSASWCLSQMYITVRLYYHHFWCMYLPLSTKGLKSSDSSFSNCFVLSLIAIYYSVYCVTD